MRAMPRFPGLIRTARPAVAVAVAALLGSTGAAAARPAVPLAMGAPESVTSAPGAAGLELAGQIGGRVSAVAIAEGHAYLGQGARLVVASWRPPALPEPLGETPARLERIADIAVRAGLAYVAGGQDGLWVADVSDPAAPRWLGGTPLDEVMSGIGAYRPAALRVAVGDGLVAVTTDDHVQFVDVADPAAPRVGSHWRVHQGDDYGDSPRGVAFVGHYAYVAQTEDGLAVLDLADPAAPRQVARLTTVRARAIVTDGGTAYVALDEPAGLLVLDVRVPADPRLLADLPLARPPGDLWLSGGRVYLLHMDAANGLGDDLALPGAVTVVDVANPAEPRALGFHTLGEMGTYTAYDFVGPYALTAGADGRLSVVDVPGVPALAMLGAYAPGWYHTAEMAVDGGHLFALDYYGQLQVMGLSTPGEPGPARTLAPGFAACSMAVADGHVYLGRRGGGLAVVDARDPADLRVVGELDAAWTACDLAVDGYLLAVAAAGDGLRVVDVSDPAAPVERTTEGLSIPAFAVALTGGHAFVAPDCCTEPPQIGVQIIDLADPASPQVVGTLAEDLVVIDVVAGGGRALVYGLADDGASNPLVAYDVSVPARPKPIARLPFGRQELYSFSHIALRWPLAAGVSYEGVVVADLTRLEPAEWVLNKGSWPSLYGLALADGHVYAGHAWQRGYTVARLPAPGSPATALTGYSLGSPGIERAVATTSTVYALSRAHWDLGGHDLLEVIDVRAAERPRRIQAYADWDRVLDLDLAGGKLLVLAERSGRADLQALALDPAGTLVAGPILALDGVAGWVSVDGTTAWVFGAAAPPTVTAVALADPPGLGLIARQPLRGVRRLVDAAVVNGRAYLLTDTGLAVWDMSDPRAPRPLGLLAMESDWVLGLAVADGWAYAVDRTADRTAGRLRVMDVRDPSAPKLAAQIGVSPWGGVFTLAEGRLFLGRQSAQDMAVLDVSTPTAPRILRTDHLWRVEDLAVTGDRAWLAAGTAGLYGLDLAHVGVTPEATTADWSWSAVSDLARAGDLVAVAAGADGLRLLSFAAPAHPLELGAAPWLAPAHDVALVAGHAYVATGALVAEGAPGIAVLDVARPDQPRQVAAVDVPGAAQVLAHGDTVHVMGGEGLTVLDATDPTGPRVLGRLAGVGGRLALRADGRLGVTSRGEVLDLADSRQPRMVSRIDLGWTAVCVALAGSRAYFGGGAGVPGVYDLAEPMVPRKLGEGAVPGYHEYVAGAEYLPLDAHSLAAQGQWLFAGDRRGSVVAYDLARPNDVRLATYLERGPTLEPGSDAWRLWPDRPVTALLASPEALLVGGAEDGLWWLARTGRLAARWTALLPLALHGTEPSGW